MRAGQRGGRVLETLQNFAVGPLGRLIGAGNLRYLLPVRTQRAEGAFSPVPELGPHRRRDLH